MAVDSNLETLALRLHDQFAAGASEADTEATRTALDDVWYGMAEDDRPRFSNLLHDLKLLRVRTAATEHVEADDERGLQAAARAQGLAILRGAAWRALGFVLVAERFEGFAMLHERLEHDAADRIAALARVLVPGCRAERLAGAPNMVEVERDGVVVTFMRRRDGWFGKAEELGPDGVDPVAESEWVPIATWEDLVKELTEAFAHRAETVAKQAISVAVRDWSARSPADDA